MDQSRPLDSNGNPPLPGQTDIYEMLRATEHDPSPKRLSRQERIRGIVKQYVPKGERNV